VYENGWREGHETRLEEGEEEWEAICRLTYKEGNTNGQLEGRKVQTELTTSITINLSTQTAPTPSINAVMQTAITMTNASMQTTTTTINIDIQTTPAISTTLSPASNQTPAPQKQQHTLPSQLTAPQQHSQPLSSHSEMPIATATSPLTMAMKLAVNISEMMTWAMSSTQTETTALKMATQAGNDPQ